MREFPDVESCQPIVNKKVFVQETGDPRGHLRETNHAILSLSAKTKRPLKFSSIDYSWNLHMHTERLRETQEQVTLQTTPDSISSLHKSCQYDTLHHTPYINTACGQTNASSHRQQIIHMRWLGGTEKLTSYKSRQCGALDYTSTPCTNTMPQRGVHSRRSSLWKSDYIWYSTPKSAENKIRDKWSKPSQQTTCQMELSREPWFPL